MAIVTRTRAGGKKVYYVTFVYNGTKVWEKAGNEIRYARSLSKQRRQEVKDGSYIPSVKLNPTVKEYAETWIAKRATRSLSDEQRMLKYVIAVDWFANLRMENVRVVHIRQALTELRLRKDARTGKAWSPKYIGNIYGVIVTMFRDALEAEVIPRNPCTIKRDELHRKSVKQRSIYAPDAIAALLGSDKVHPSSRVFIALLFLLGGREGEICALRWSDWDRGAKPLGCVTIERQYNDRMLKTDKHVVGEHARQVPVHPTLEAILSWWWSAGFEIVYLRKPRSEDRIVPSFGRGKGRLAKDGGGRPRVMGTHTKSSAYKMWVKACEAAGVPNVSMHSTRHTFVTMARRHGANPTVVQKITHNAAGDVLDRYTHWDWAPLCEAVLCLPMNVGTVVTSLVTRFTDPAELGRLIVEAPGIEPGSPLATTRHHYEGMLRDDAQKPRENAPGDGERTHFATHDTKPLLPAPESHQTVDVSAMAETLNRALAAVYGDVVGRVLLRGAVQS